MLVQWQKEIQEEVGKAKYAISELLDWSVWQKRAKEFLTNEKITAVFAEDKAQRSESIDKNKKDFIAKFQEEIEQDKLSIGLVEYIFDQELKKQVTTEILNQEKKSRWQSF